MKLGNLFLNKNMEIKVGDLGLSAKLATAEERKKTFVEPPITLPPRLSLVTLIVLKLMFGL